MTYSYGGEGTNPLTEIPKGTEILKETGVGATELVGYSYTEVGNFEACGLVSTEEVADYLREIPPTHLDKCPSIQYEPKPSEWNPNTKGTFDSQSHEIKVWQPFEQLQSKEDIFYTLTHEVGRNVHANIMADQPDIAEQWSELHGRSLIHYSQDGSGFVSGSAHTNTYEDFAETYANFVCDPEKLQFYSQEKYEFMKQEVFDREYPPPILGRMIYNPVEKSFKVTDRVSFGSYKELVGQLEETPTQRWLLTEQSPQTLEQAGEWLNNPRTIEIYKDISEQIPSTLPEVQKWMQVPENAQVVINFFKQIH